jgi:hypothetical protein
MSNCTAISTVISDNILLFINTNLTMLHTMCTKCLTTSYNTSQEEKSIFIHMVDSLKRDMFSTTVEMVFLGQNFQPH